MGLIALFRTKTQKGKMRTLAKKPDCSEVLNLCKNYSVVLERHSSQYNLSSAIPDLHFRQLFVTIFFSSDIIFNYCVL